ncbi:hypothetical protein ALC60_07942 [Trachymyrmex zeteki]|uniref:Uncharacterized protein n=1 Tax=Mycetomoellerius zeteki TaxID=64791 RepID=A0A151WY99_9HYME|nr:hypothetical protein ALC60_07942 [Trachymyrmex zeteki]
MAHGPVHETTTAAVSVEKLRDRLRRRPSDPNTLRRASLEPRTMTRTRFLRYFSRVLQIGLAIALVAASQPPSSLHQHRVSIALSFEKSREDALSGRKQPAGPRNVATTVRLRHSPDETVLSRTWISCNVVGSICMVNGGLLSFTV